MKTVTLPGGEAVPALGMGSWMMGEVRANRARELAALQAGLDAGLSLIDTAEMYGDGESERLVGEAIRGRRDGVFLVSKVYPFNAGHRSMISACEASLKRLGTDRLDAYLLHWPGSIALDETLEAFERLQREGKIRYWGLSNFTALGIDDVLKASHGKLPVCNQVLYNLGRRGIEWDLQPWCRAHGIPLMAYSPLEQSRLLHDPGLGRIAASLNVTPAQLALAWLLGNEQCIIIPKASSPPRVLENAAALSLELDAATRAALNIFFPPPAAATPLEML
ncbi:MULTISPECIES: aldo/keto reductase [unclassified Uliginosibacterium]|uniref:aldo/keto reductase n=1 Tax=unclassified Uliginosibacterium TaxID=2621521 RepID=UPI000C7A4D1E|nr:MULTISPECIES: aldo/keto reductase [unclassified Uliginosibacterium]MDO6386501.1 aldo/keto reductase [Uliginosibacterium sp. 31-12]PLK50340.1 aldo/keto reductase [Uliginosibacterium sp. TH139]